MSTNAIAKVVQGTRTVASWRGFIGLSLFWCSSSVVARALTGPKLPQIIQRRWCEGIVRDVGIEIVAQGVEKVAGQPCVIVANHASLLDIPVMGSLLDIEHRWVAKKQLFRVPLVGWHLWACGHISVDRKRAGNLERMQQQVEAVLAAGHSVVFFPEGTRSPDGALKSFRSGAFACAVEAGVPVLPLVLDGTHELLVKGSLEFPRGANRQVRARVLDRVEVPRPSGPRGSEEHTAAVEALRDEVRRRMVDALDELRGGPGRAEQPSSSISESRA